MPFWRRLPGAIALSLLIGALGVPVSAQTFPAKPVRILSPYPTGISPDIATRLVAERLSARWNQPVVVEPRPGGNGFIAIGAAKRGAADGHELLLVGNAHLTINPHVFKALPYDAEADFMPVALLYRAPFFMTVAANGPYRTLQDLITAARADPQRVAYSTPYVGSPPHLGAALLAQLSGTQMLGVHFREGAQIYTSVANGDVAFTLSTIGSARSLISAGKLRPLLVAAPARLPSEPDVPTAAEAGAPPGFIVDSWVGLVAPRGTPAEVVQRIAADVVAVLAEPSVRDRYRSLGVIGTPVTPVEMSTLIREDLRRNGDIVRRSGITPE